MKVGILGTGAYGCSLSKGIANNGHKIMMWTPFEQEKEMIEKTREIRSLPGFKLDDSITITNDLDEIINFSTLLIVAIPSQTVDSLFQILGEKITDDKHICITSKGIEEKTGLFMNEVLEKYTDTKNVAVISGPSFAIDLVNNNTCGLALATKNDETAKIVEKVLASDCLRLRRNTDIVGTEICGSMKNVIAIASGMLDGLKTSDSTRAMLLTDALHDMADLIVNFGGSERTILSYAGFGDLMLTCGSAKSRNYCFGKLVGEGATQEEIAEYLKNNTVEGYCTLQSLYKMLRNRDFKIPMINLIYRIVVGKTEPCKLLSFLVERD